VLTVSQASALQLRQFCDRYQIKHPDIEVTYEGSFWESRRGEAFQKKNYALHLSSPAPHKGTNRLLNHWKVLQQRGLELPELMLVGRLDEVGQSLYDQLKNVSQIPPLEFEKLQQTVGEAAVLLLPSEIEGFGLPALEAYYVGTPVCFAAGTSVSEVVDPMGHGGCYSIDDVDAFSESLDWARGLSPETTHAIGATMHERFSLAKVSDRIVNSFRSTVK
jgi:glycosyltransferase involved in cell wall biosynthesis